MYIDVVDELVDFARIDLKIILPMNAEETQHAFGC